MTAWLRDAEQRMGRKILADDLAGMDAAARQQELAEGFSWLARANATGRVADSSLPDQVKAFFRAFKEYIANVLRIAAEFARVRAGLDPEFTHWLDVSAGLTAERRDAVGGAMEIDADRSDGSIAPGPDNATTFSMDPDRALEIHSRIEAQAPLDVSLENVPIGMAAKEARQWPVERGALGRTSHPDLGDIEIRSPRIRGAEERSPTPQKVAVLARLKELIPRATGVTSPGRGDSNQVRLAARLQVGGRDYVARIVIDTDARGRRFYNHELSDLRELPIERAHLDPSTGMEESLRAAPDITREAVDLVGWLESSGSSRSESKTRAVSSGGGNKSGREDYTETETADGGKIITMKNGHQYTLDRLGRTVRVVASLKLNPD